MKGIRVDYVVVDEAQDWLDELVPHPTDCQCRGCVEDELTEDDYR